MRWSGDTRLRLRVLGGLAAARDGVAVDLGGRRQRAVLAALVVMRDQVVTTERLAGWVWGDSAPANTPGAVQAYVSHLRRRLQPEAGARRRDGVIASSGAGYVLRLGPETVDAWCFERAVDSARAMAPADTAVPSTTRCGCGGDRPTPSTPASRGSRPRRSGSRSSATSPGSDCSRRACSWATPRCWSVSSRRWSPRTPCGSSGGDCWCSPSTEPSARRTRSRPCGGRAPPWPRSWASTRGPPCAPWRPRCSRSHPHWTGHHRR